MKTLVYRITLLEPGLVTALDGDPNSAVAFSFLPGSQLRGALLYKYRDGKKLDPADDTAQRLFFNGTTQFTNGYPIVHEQRAQPMPLMWQAPKREKGFARNAVVTALDDAKQWDALKEPFIVFDGDKAILSTPKRQLTIHTARNRRLGRPQEQGRVRPDEDGGAIYRYEALAPQQTFEAQIHCADEDAAMLEKLLEGEIQIGGARTGAYGRARLEFVPEKENAKTQTQALNSAPSRIETNKLIVTLESDVLLRDAHGNYTTDKDAVRDALAARLGVGANTLIATKAFIKMRLIGGFNRTWGLPLPQMLALQMGSVFVFETTSSQLNLELLRGNAIGERRAEGFGQVRAEWGGLAEIKIVKPDAAKDKNTPALDATSRTLAQTMVKRMVRKRLDENVLSAANGFEMKEESLRPIHKAQLSRLRNLVHDFLMEPKSDLKRVTDFLDKMNKRQTTRKQYERARVEGASLKQWLDDVLKPNSERVNKIVNIQDVPSVGDVKPALEEGMKQEYALKFIDAVLRRALAVKRGEEN